METKLLLMYLKYAKELEINNFNTFKKELAIIQDYFRSYLYGKISYQEYKIKYLAKQEEDARYAAENDKVFYFLKELLDQAKEQNPNLEEDLNKILSRTVGLSPFHPVKDEVLTLDIEEDDKNIMYTFKTYYSRKMDNQQVEIVISMNDNNEVRKIEQVRIFNSTPKLLGITRTISIDNIDKCVSTVCYSDHEEKKDVVSPQKVIKK